MKRFWFALAIVFAVAPCASAQGVQAKVSKDHIDFVTGEELVTRYHTSGFTKPIFWPLNAPGGIPLTRSWPMEKAKPGEATDHIHQKSAWFCHGDVIPEGLQLKSKIKNVDGVDFWSEAPGHGDIVCTSVGEPKMKAHAVSIVTKNEWRTAEGQKILDETRTITLQDFGKARLLILDIDLLASTYPITFGDTKEGAMGIRINHDINAGKGGKGKIQNAEGKVGEKDCWGRISTWSDYSGPLEGKTVGLAILADSKNMVPTCWHSRGYGLNAANPFGRVKAGFPDTKDAKADLVKIAKGQHLKLRYGLLAHEGDAVTGRVADYYERFMQLRGDE